VVGKISKKITLTKRDRHEALSGGRRRQQVKIASVFTGSDKQEELKKLVLLALLVICQFFQRDCECKTITFEALPHGF